MRIRRLSLAVALSLAIPFAVAQAGNPIPGVGIVVKKCKCTNPCCTTARISVPGGFFGPGSPAFDGTIGMQGREDGTADGRIDYSSDTNAGPFVMTMAAMTLYSQDPIQVDLSGVPSFFDVSVELSGPGPESNDPIPGTMTLAPGTSLDPGTVVPVAAASLGITYKIMFHDHTTGEQAGTFIAGDLEAILKNLGLLNSAACVADGTPTGHIVFGSDGATASDFAFGSANDELVIQMLSLDQLGPVSAQATTWGAVKSMYR
jgi:hypothetical protein